MFGKGIVNIVATSPDKTTEIINTFVKKLPFRCKYCVNDIYYCFLCTYDDREKNNCWLTEPFNNSFCTEYIDDYLGKRTPIACINEDCQSNRSTCEKWKLPLLRFYIEELVNIDIRITNTIYVSC